MRLALNDSRWLGRWPCRHRYNFPTSHPSERLLNDLGEGNNTVRKHSILFGFGGLLPSEARPPTQDAPPVTHDSHGMGCICTKDDDATSSPRSNRATRAADSGDSGEDDVTYPAETTFNGIGVGSGGDDGRRRHRRSARETAIQKERRLRERQRHDQAIRETVEAERTEDPVPPAPRGVPAPKTAAASATGQRMPPSVGSSPPPPPQLPTTSAEVPRATAGPASASPPPPDSPPPIDPPSPFAPIPTHVIVVQSTVRMDEDDPPSTTQNRGGYPKDNAVAPPRSSASHPSPPAPFDSTDVQLTDLDDAEQPPSSNSANSTKANLPLRDVVADHHLATTGGSVETTASAGAGPSRNDFSGGTAMIAAVLAQQRAPVVSGVAPRQPWQSGGGELKGSGLPPSQLASPTPPPPPPVPLAGVALPGQGWSQSTAKGQFFFMDES